MTDCWETRSPRIDITLSAAIEHHQRRTLVPLAFDLTERVATLTGPFRPSSSSVIPIIGARLSLARGTKTDSRRDGPTNQ